MTEHHMLEAASIAIDFRHDLAVLAESFGLVELLVHLVRARRERSR